jgi:hypothetical protein
MRSVTIYALNIVGYQIQGKVFRQFICTLFAGLCCSFIVSQNTRQKFTRHQFALTKTKTEILLRQSSLFLPSCYNTEKVRSFPTTTLQI